MKGLPMEENETEEKIIGRFPVDTGMFLIVDPAFLKQDVEELLKPDENGVVKAVLVRTPAGDGWYELLADDGALIILDPWGNIMDKPNGGWETDDPWGTDS